MLQSLCPCRYTDMDAHLQHGLPQTVVSGGHDPGPMALDSGPQTLAQTLALDPSPSL